MDIFFQDPWWLILIKVVALFVILLVWTIFNVWYERRLVGKMQHRLGPIMNGPFGLGQALADGAKLLAKEDFRPKNADKWIFNLAPILTGVAAFTAWTVIPFGGEVTIAGYTTRLQVADLPVATIFILAVASIGIYGIVLAGWAGNSTYSFLGSIRSTAQMISYEISMGLSIVAVLLMAGTMSTNGIVQRQAETLPLGIPFTDIQFDLGITGWYALLLFPSFIIYAISMVGETNRAPFDLPECESELVSGYLTEYSGFRYAMFFLAEYINMATVSAVCTTLFLGGYLPPWPLNLIPFLNNAWLGPIWFIIKVQLLISVFVWLRGTLPRLRYDQFMNLGWKVLIEVSLVWIVIVAVVARTSFRNSTILLGVGLMAALYWFFFIHRKNRAIEKPLEREFAMDDVFDPFAGGYPIPPRPGQTLPEFASVVTGAEPQVDTDTSDTTTEGKEF
ncbi:NADH-quinone oxidoreductase subunit NuoH [Tessaracoccus flavus]|jgi:NADH-quinone oxidoreductase subunit H|uniref:NADH-quinone oxidoreductase subunit H n=1 Tax=Tessaracoccus flavus TaxID=1610493 RepID=A0A1Q2CCK3_9ACTN|nr:NADH-quinone oxidoreductase subunit NuoH [Tessaracoccus flavus]AQP43853.1 NADH-quinone oxidoreductase subunit H [Tessaracoccus flavus]SDY26283.1 NADH dehydrogenase subunit H [Tessaracoccus flavus]